MGQSFMNLIMHESQVCVLCIYSMHLCILLHYSVNHLCAAVGTDLSDEWVSLHSLSYRYSCYIARSDIAHYKVF